LNFNYTREVVPFLWVPCLGFWLIAPFGLAGTIKSLWRGVPEERLLALIVFLWMGSVTLFHVADRYRLAIVPLLVILGCGFILNLAESRGPARRRELFAGLSLLAASAAFVNLPNFYPGGQDPAPFDRVMGYGFKQDGRAQLAQAYNRKAAEEFYRQGRYHLERGEVYRAEIYFRGALDAVPDFPGARYHHGFTLERLDRIEEAIAEYDRAVGTDSFAVEALTHLGTLYMRGGQLEAAQSALAKAAQRDPQRFLTLVALADLRVRQQRFAEARVLYERALSQQPEAAWLKGRIARLPP
jgi:tetratricopeptide (TPR) repeat protein